MNAELDHLIICCAVGGPEAALLARVGLKEGSPNRHPGQGTACRRFFFQNAYIELLWVSEPAEAQSESTRPTRLWERWSERRGGACPFGILLRPGAEGGAIGPPFPTERYQPRYLPPHLAIEIALGTPMHEPGLFHLGFQRGHAGRAQEPTAHANGATEITSVGIGLPGEAPRSAALQSVEAMGVVDFHPAESFVMELTCDKAIRGKRVDLRPDLPLVLKW